MAKRSKNKLTPNQIEYAKEVRRIQRFVRNAEKRGYRFDENVVPQTPKRITKKVLQRVKETRPNDLYKKASYLDENTGKVVGGLEGRKLERQESARKSAETRKRNKEQETPYYPKGGEIITDNIVDEFLARLLEPEPPVFPYNNRLASKMESLIQARRNGKTTILSLTYTVIAEIGKSALGWRLQERVDDVQEALNVLLYRGSSSEDIVGACSELASIINGAELTFSQLQDIAEQEDYNESYEFPQ